MLELWPIAVPAIVVVMVAIAYVRRSWTPRAPELALADAPAVPVDQLLVRRSAVGDLDRAGALVEPTVDGSLGGRMRQAIDAGAMRGSSDRRVRVRRRERPLTAA